MKFSVPRSHQIKVLFSAGAMALAAASVAVAAVGPGPESGSGEDPSLAGQGNVPDCPAGTEAIMISPEHASTISESNKAGTVTISVSGRESPDPGDNLLFDFTVTGGTVSVVYVKASPDINTFNYAFNSLTDPNDPAGPVSGDTNLHAPLRDGSTTEFQHIVHVTYCVAPTGSPSAARFQSFSAIKTLRGVQLRWRTGSEVDTLGFNVYREVKGKRVKLNRSLIASASIGGTAGHSYSFLERLGLKAKAPRYWLQVVDLDGKRTWHGPARVGSARS